MSIQPLLDNFDPQVLSPENGMFVFRLGILKDSEKPLEESELIHRTPLVEIIQKRKESLELPFVLKEFFTGLSIVTFVNNPGKAIALLWMCNELYKKGGIKVFDYDVWCKRMFPYGVLSEKCFDKWWMSQKHTPKDHFGSSNLVDYPENWK